MKTTTKRKAKEKNKLRKMMERNENSKIPKSNKITGGRRRRIRCI
jgi:hypothetical protein